MIHVPRSLNHNTIAPQGLYNVPQGFSEPNHRETVACYVVPMAHLERSPSWIADKFSEALYLIEEFGGGVCYEGHIPQLDIRHLGFFPAPKKTQGHAIRTISRKQIGRKYSESLACYVVPHSYLDEARSFVEDIFISSLSLVEEHTGLLSYEGQVPSATLDSLKFFRVSS